MRPGRLCGIHGYSLVEIMVTIVLLGIVVGAVVPNFARFNANQKVYQAASELEAVFRRARSLAISRNIDVRVSINDQTGSYVLQRDNDGDGTFETQVSAGSISGHVLLADVDLSGGSMIAFDSRGVPDNPGTVLLRKGDHERQLIISPGSGAVTVIVPDPPDAGN